MELCYLLLSGVLCLLIAWFIKHLISRPNNLPPGPTGFINVAWQLFSKGSSDPLALFSSWAKKYGEIVSFYVGTKTIVILNSYPVIVEAFRHPDLQDRLQSQLLQEILGLKNCGIAFSSGETWKQQRKFGYSTFRSLGVGKKSYEDTVSAEMSQLCSAIEETKGAPFDPCILLMQAVSNITSSIIFGTQYKYGDIEFKKLLHLINKNAELAGGGGAILFLPIPGISRIPFGIVKTMTDNIRALNAFIDSQIESHECNWDQTNPKDFIDQYLNKLEETKDIASSFSKIQLIGCINDLFYAGSETTTTTLKWCILFMMAYPKVQSRVQDELDHVVGRERTPRLDDMKDLPCTNAVLLEVQRMGSIAPLGVPHVAAADTNIRGYTIPKGAIIVSNIYEVLNSEDLWTDPSDFKPERFLTADGDLIHREELIFFGTGRRVCLGEQLARMETFLGFTSLLQRFTFQKPDSSPTLSFDGILGFTRNPLPYQTRAVVRV
ncbi:cytochrome P450 2J4-like [Lytechinus pictus]|uniref:cytochrome P450 2J4-like n=1 Tax=Lytechinus pictus TaxID=7653 RepID=UPI0030BA1979